MQPVVKDSSHDASSDALNNSISATQAYVNKNKPDAAAGITDSLRSISADIRFFRCFSLGLRLLNLGGRKAHAFDNHRSTNVNDPGTTPAAESN